MAWTASALAERLPWYVAGPCIGLLIVTLFAFTARPLGMLGGYVELAEGPGGRRYGARAALALGTVLGALLFSLAAGGPLLRHDYGALDAALPRAAKLALLLGAGVLMGYGARRAGGCTSGHGLTGSAFLSPASLVATGTFVAVGIATAHVAARLLGVLP